MPATELLPFYEEKWNAVMFLDRTGFVANTHIKETAYLSNGAIYSEGEQAIYTEKGQEWKTYREVVFPDGSRYTIEREIQGPGHFASPLFDTIEDMIQWSIANPTPPEYTQYLEPEPGKYAVYVLDKGHPWVFPGWTFPGY